MPALLQQGRLASRIERAAGLHFQLLGFGAQAVAQLLDDVVLRALRQLTANGGEIAIDEVHGVPACDS